MAPKIADALTQHGMKVTQRSVRERFDKLCSDFKEREREEKQASGIDVEYDDNHNGGDTGEGYGCGNEEEGNWEIKCQKTTKQR